MNSPEVKQVAQFTCYYSKCLVYFTELKEYTALMH